MKKGGSGGHVISHSPFLIKSRLNFKQVSSRLIFPITCNDSMRPLCTFDETIGNISLILQLSLNCSCIQDWLYLQRQYSHIGQFFMMSVTFIATLHSTPLCKQRDRGDDPSVCAVQFSSFPVASRSNSYPGNTP